MLPRYFDQIKNLWMRSGCHQTVSPGATAGTLTMASTKSECRVSSATKMEEESKQPGKLTTKH